MSKMLLVPPVHIVREAEEICYKRSAKACMPDHDLDSEWPEDDWVTMTHGYILNLYVADDNEPKLDGSPQDVTWRGTLFHYNTGSTPDSPSYNVFEHHKVVERETA